MTQASVYWKQLLFEKQHAVFVTTKWATGRYSQRPLMSIMTNNCHRGQAVQNARDPQTMLLFPEQNQT
jgi:hypothetical protein